jgi:transketolase
MRYEAYGWHVQNLGEDLSLERIEEAARTAMAVHDRPSLIICRTHIAQGAPNKQDDASAHGAPLGEDEVKLTKEGYGWPTDETFYVPEEALAHFRSCIERGEELEAAWEERAAAYREAEPEKWAELERIMSGRLPEGWDEGRPRFGPDVGQLATRKASHQVIQWVAERVPEFVGGSADLAPSTLTLIDGGGDVEKHHYGGRNLHFGIREHGMGAIVNGLNLHGFRAFGATFLIFSDYMKGAMRLSAFMELPSIFVFTHDSIGLGEDGPTHQPVEQLVGLRAIPGLYVVRPAGANETALAWRFALSQQHNPTAMALSRQGLPVWDPDGVPDHAIERGAYVLYESDGGEPELILVGTGSEVHLCVDAARLLEQEGTRARVVSMPCVERFLEQDHAYQEEILSPALRARVAVEAASPIGWDRIVGDAGDVIGMTTFGASAPYKDVYNHFGFTPERVAERAREVLGRVT